MKLSATKIIAYAEQSCLLQILQACKNNLFMLLCSLDFLLSDLPSVHWQLCNILVSNQEQENNSNYPVQYTAQQFSVLKLETTVLAPIGP